jgi:hypothetical protein
MLAAAAMVPGLEAPAARMKSTKTATSGALKSGVDSILHEVPHTDGDCRRY